MPCPFCGAHTCVHTIEGHIATAHPEHFVHLFPRVDFCPHIGFQPVLFGRPPSTLPSFVTPMMVN